MRQCVICKVGLQLGNGIQTRMCWFVVEKDNYD